MRYEGTCGSPCGVFPGNGERLFITGPLCLNSFFTPIAVFNQSGALKENVSPFINCLHSFPKKNNISTSLLMLYGQSIPRSYSIAMTRMCGFNLGFAETTEWIPSRAKFLRWPQKQSRVATLFPHHFSFHALIHRPVRHTLMWFVIPSLTPSFTQDMLTCQKNRTNDRLLIKGWSTDSLSPKAPIGKKLSQVTEQLQQCFCRLS